ncbi:hypothetical protein JCM33374_g3580 [Metschnikowia sp. JCM 33374]|nr:hypothetical protein JCM33374_g3580 [Metschnikowia sp. JCM 33374]
MSFQILACGSNGSFQLGLGNDKDHNTLQHVPGLEHLSAVAPKMFAFGGNHTLVLYPDGHLLATGDNEFGQCGIESPSKLEQFTRVPGKWKAVAAGWQFSILCSFDDVLYSCGYGPKGELGLGKHRPISPAPQKLTVPISDTVDSIQCSISHTVVKLSSGVLVGWGASRKGQLGSHAPILTASGKAKAVPALWDPVVLSFGKEAKEFCLGRDRTILVGDSINVLGSEPHEVHVRARSVKSMWSSIHYIAQDETTIHSVGNNSHGQCFEYELPGAVKDFTVGSEHGLVLSADNCVYAWGWGEHGNCGVMRDDNVTFDFLNKVYGEDGEGEGEVVMIAGGLATTWVVVKRGNVHQP